MKIALFLYFARFGLRTILLRRQDPILGTIILTDRCNLHCKHCSVNNITMMDQGALVLNLKSAFPHRWYI